MSIAKATRRIRNTKGSSYLTKGSDNYDHRGMKKAQRQLSRALIEEAIAEVETQKEPRWKWVLAAYLCDGDKPWLDGFEVVGVFETYSELQGRIAEFDGTKLDWNYVDIDCISSDLAYEARLYHDQF